MLDRLTALNLIAWVREPAAIHVTVAGDAAEVLAGGEGDHGSARPSSRWASSSRTASAVARGLMPSLSSTSRPGADAPKRSIDTDRSTQRSQPIEIPASTLTDGSPGGRTSSR